MIRAGLTGGLASGKSFVADTFEQLGCHVVRADQLGHQVLARDGEAYLPVVELFGQQVLNNQGDIDRKLLAATVFDAPQRLQQLNAIVHPAVIRLEEEFLQRAETADPSGIGIVEAAILIETGSYRRFRKLIVVVCSFEQQVQRAMQRDNSSREQVMARLSKQMSVEEKLRYADYVIDTSGTKEQTAEQTAAVYGLLRSLDIE